MNEIFLVAGDPSADVHGANLILSIKKNFPGTRVVCLGGKRMAKYADEFLYDLVGMSAFGLHDAIGNFNKFNSIFRSVVVPYLNKKTVSVVVPIDFYGFNIHVCEESKRQGVPVVYYISPQVWASRKGRVARLSKCVNKMLTILPFEEIIYQSAGMNTVFVGHPLLDNINSDQVIDWEARGESKELICGLFPGSRKNVIAKHVPLLLKVAELIQESVSNVEFQIVQAVDVPDDYLNKLVCKSKVKIEIVKDEDYAYRRRMSAAIACSGTVTMENALLGLPTVIVYKTNWLFYIVARMVVQVEHIGLANIIAGTKFMPEFIQNKAIPEPIANITLNWLQNLQYRKRLGEALSKLRSKLGVPGVAKRVAQEIMDVIR
ncbi:MAG: lipid-A-disaccharide synthase [Elusimicrobiota bacterium]